MTTRKGVRADLVTIIKTNAGIRTIGFIPDTIPAPCATVSIMPFDPRLVFGESVSSYQLQVRLWVPRTSERAGQDMLDDWAEMSGSSSVVAAIQTTSNWSQTIHYASVTQIGEIVEIAKADDTFLTIDIDVEVVW